MTTATQKPTATADPTKQKTESAPLSACMFESPLFGDQKSTKFAEGDDYEEGSPYPVRLLVRSREPVQHWYWYGGKVYHDLEGMELHRERIILDYNHGTEIGWLQDKQIDQAGYWLSGQIIPTGSAADPAGDVIKRGRGGVPYEASIFFDDPMQIEYIDDGLQGEVNGMTVDGPCTIVRKCKLRATATCAHGRDANTATQFSESDPVEKVVKFSVVGSENTPPPSEASAMSKSTPKADDPQEQGNKPAGGEATTDKPNEQSSGEGSSAESSSAGEGSPNQQSESAHDQVRAELKRFTDRFGNERGLQYFNEGVSFAAALEADHTRLSEANEKLNQKLGAKGAVEELGEGETETGEFSSDGTDSQEKDRKGKFRFVGGNKS